MANADVYREDVTRIEKKDRTQDDPTVLELVELVNCQLSSLPAFAKMAATKSFFRKFRLTVPYNTNKWICRILENLMDLKV